MNDNEFKSKSLEDNVYFTLRDIFWNGDINDCATANYFNGILTNNTTFEERDKNFKYTNLLYDYNSDFTKKLYYWICRMTNYNKDYVFDFEKPQEDEKIDIREYVKYDDWWEQFLELRKKLQEQLEKHIKWKSDDIKRERDMVTKLSEEYEDN
jgi:hypothetical protein